MAEEKTAHLLGKCGYGGSSLLTQKVWLRKQQHSYWESMAWGKHVYWESMIKGKAACLMGKHGSGKSSVSTGTAKMWLREKQPVYWKSVAKGKAESTAWGKAV